MRRPYQHHHGRKSLDEYIGMLPVDIRNLALKYRTKDWAMIHVYSICRAVWNIIDKKSMSAEEVEFWVRVYRHYLNDGTLPNISDYTKLSAEKASAGMVFPSSTTKMEMMRIVFRHADRPLCGDDVYTIIHDHGYSIKKNAICHNLSYLTKTGDLEVVGEKDSRKPGRKEKLYRWKTK